MIYLPKGVCQSRSLQGIHFSKVFDKMLRAAQVASEKLILISISGSLINHQSCNQTENKIKTKNNIHVSNSTIFFTQIGGEFPIRFLRKVKILSILYRKLIYRKIFRKDTKFVVNLQCHKQQVDQKQDKTLLIFTSKSSTNKCLIYYESLSGAL